MLRNGCIAVLGAAIFLLLMTPSPAEAKIDKAAQARNWAIAERLLNDTKTDIPSQVDAVKALAGLLDYDHAIKLLAFWAECDKAGQFEKDARGEPKKPGKDARPRDAYKVAVEILKCIAVMNEPAEVLKFKEDVANKVKWPLRVRMAMLDSMGACGADPECSKFILSMAQSGADTDMRVLAITALMNRAGEPAVFELACQTLNDKSWRIRDVSIDLIVACAGSDKDRAVLALINRLSQETGKLKLNLSLALKGLTNEALGTDADAWIDWFKENKRKEQGLPPKRGDGKDSTRARRIFETDSFSDRYIFVIDASVSMTEPIPPEELELLKKQLTKDPSDTDKRRPLDWTKINCKLDLAREEMIRSLEVLDPKLTFFTIISFADDIRIWSEDLKPCEKKMVDEAAGWLRGLRGKKQTNISAALDAAFDMSERLAGIDPEKLKKKEKGVVTGRHPDEFIPDTIFLYSDGYATTGKFGGNTEDKAKHGEKYPAMYRVIMTDFLAEIRDRNRIARLTINTVGVGVQDDWFLGRLAKSNGGSYLALAKVNKK